MKTLIAYYSRSGNTKKAAEAIAKIADSAYIPTLMLKLVSFDWKEKQGAIISIAYLADRGIKDKRTVPLLIGALLDKNKYIRRWAAVALGNIGDGRAFGPLISKSGDRDK
ncbi:MAG: HEAT repeat domain-containing protein, partial [Nanoarchaeota archaeon]|nr:HEAT repeat domain-containing protein [Nanoarchaeota archaeon]